MERKVWRVELDGAAHEVVLNWTYWGGDRQVVVDGALVGDDTRAMRWKSEQRFDLAGHPAVVRTRPKAKVSPYFVVTLEVDGDVVPPVAGPRSKWER